jgi:hypothetical protein
MSYKTECSGVPSQAGLDAKTPVSASVTCFMEDVDVVVATIALVWESQA